MLRHRNLGEADRALTLFTREHGKLRVSVRGARKTKSRMGGHVQPLMHASLLLVRGRSLDTVTQAQSIAVFPRLRDDLLTTTRGLHVAELVDRFAEEHEPNETLFEHVLEGLDRLDRGGPMELIVRAFELRLLEIEGYRPVLDRCVSCDSPLGGREPVSFGVGWGGVLCASCASTEAHDRTTGSRPVGSRPVSHEALAALRTLQSHGFLADPSTYPSEGGVADEIEWLLRWHLQSVLERPLETAAFLDELRGRGLGRH